MLFLNTSLSLTRFKLNRYNPLINYDWSTTTTGGLRYLKDVGSTSTYNASMYFGRGAYFNGVDQSIEHTATCSSDSVAYSFCGKQIFTSNRYNLWTNGTGISYYLVLNTEYKTISYTFNSNYNYVLNLTKNSIKLYENGLLVLNITTTDILYGTSKTIGRIGSSYYRAGYLKDFYIFNRVLTQSEITQAYEQPEAFYAMAQADSTCVLNMPMCETSSTVRDYKTGIDYQIINYTSSVRDNAKNLQYGLQTCKFVRDSLGVIQSASDYLESDGVGYAIIPNTFISASPTTEAYEFIIKQATTLDTQYYTKWTTLGQASGISTIELTKNSLSSGFLRYRSATGGGLAIKAADWINSKMYITFVCNGAKAYIYVNGILRYTENTPNNHLLLNNIYLFSESFTYNVEKMQSGSSFILFKVHSKALTQSEITENYNSYVAKGLLS